jgi:class 3 adenylate cyclase
MALLDELQTQTDEIVRAQWDRRDGTVVPEEDDVGLGNEGVDLDATFLYADLADSTELAVYDQAKSAEVVKAYLMGTTRIIRSMGGEIRSLERERVRGVVLEGTKNTNAAAAGLKINYFFSYILKPAFARVYTDTFPSKFDLKQTVGIDTSKVMVVRSGIRNNNDLVWIGRAPNAAAKLSAIRDGYATYIAESVFDAMLDDSKYGGDPRQTMWERCTWANGTPFGVPVVYRSNWWRKP